MEKKNISYLAIIAVLASFFIGMGSGFLFVPQDASGVAKIQVTGSTTCEPIVSSAANEFMKLNPGVDVMVSGTGSGSGIADTIESRSDIGMSSRNIKSSENITCYSQNGVYIIDHQFALDGLAIIIDADHPNAEEIASVGLTMQQLFLIFNGTYLSWDDVNSTWCSDAITRFTRSDDSGTRASFEELVVDSNHNELGKDTGYLANVGSAQLVGSNTLMVQAVAFTPSGIGYCGLGYIDISVKMVPIIDHGEIEPVSPTHETVRAGTYPIARYLHVITAGQSSGWTKAFIDFLYGITGQQIVEEEGFIPIYQI